MKQPIRIGTRKSPLALRQVEMVVQALQRHIPEFDQHFEPHILPLQTSGDRFLDTTLRDIGGKGLFTKEIDEALLAGEVDISVHSAKDMPTRLPAGIVWPCSLPRADARDYYISQRYPHFSDLPPGARMGTASLRRQLFCLQQQPGLVISPLRGNIQTRLKKLEAGEVDATILAAAGLERMAIKPPGHVLEIDQMLPAPAQGVIAIHCREENARMQELLQPIHCARSHQCAVIERQLLSFLDGSCRTPIAAYAQLSGKECTLQAMLGDEQTGRMSQQSITGSAEDYANLAHTLAGQLKAALNLPHPG